MYKAFIAVALLALSAAVQAETCNPAMTRKAPDSRYTVQAGGTEVLGMRLPVLRETRMPAVVLAVGPARAAADEVPHLASALTRAVQLWISRAT